MAAENPLTIFPVGGLPEIGPGDDLPAIICRVLDDQSLAPEDGDVLVVAQKIVSKAENSRVSLQSVVPSPFALGWAEKWDRDPRLIELVLRESRRIIRMERGVIITETRHGFVCANAGIDLSNSGEDEMAILLPEDSDRSAEEIRRAVRVHTGRDTAVIVADSFGRPWRSGLTQVALGVAGLAPLIDLRGEPDGDGRPLHVTIIAVADELASAAELVCGKSARMPAAIVRGYGASGRGSGKDLLRPPDMDMFR